MFLVCCHDRYTSRATRLTSRTFLNEAKQVALELKKAYQHVTVSEVATGKIHMQRKDRGCCKVSDIVFKDGSAL